MTELSITELAAVTGGTMDEKTLRGWASENCPHTYSKLKNKTQAQLTRADANQCVAEAKPGFLMRTMIESQLDDYFKK